MGCAEPSRRQLAAVALLAASLAACVAERTEVDGAGAARAASLRAAAAAGRDRVGDWRQWYRRLEAADAGDRVGPRFLHRQGAERPMYSDRGLGDGSRLEGQVGPWATLTDLAGQLRRAGVDFLVLPVPALSAVYPRDCVEGAPAGPTPRLDWRLLTFYARLEDEGIEVLDLLPAFLDPPPWDASATGLTLPAEGDPLSSHGLLFRLQDRHWTARGSQLAAHEVARRIERYPWFDDVRAAMGQGVLDDRWILETERGPIARRLVAAGRLPADHPAETYLRRRTRIQGEIWSLDDRQSPILLLGDSFANTSHGFLDGLLAELGFRVDRITVPGGEPSRQLEVLRLRGDGLAGKRLVVWQFTVASLASPHLWRPAAIVPE